MQTTVIGHDGLMKSGAGHAAGAAAVYANGFMQPPAGRGFLVGSMLLHAVLLTALAIGLPHMEPPPIRIVEAVPVEITTVDEKTRVPEVRKPAEIKETVKPKPESEKPPLPAKMDLPAPPDLTRPLPPKAPEKASEPEKKDASASPVPDERNIPVPARPERKPRPPVPPKTEDTPEDKVRPASQKDLASVLRNLNPDSPDEETAQETVRTPIAERMTISENEALRRQISQCWNLLAGARYAEDLVVDVRLAVNPDRTVKQARVVDQLRYTSDPVFRAAADTALRVFGNPDCNPLDLPPNKYEQWKSIKIRFDPREMLQ